MNETGWRPWLPEGIAALTVLAVGLTESAVFWAMTDGRLFGFVQVPQALIVAVAVGMSRRAPGAALGLLWGLCLLHALTFVPVMLTEFALTAVVFGGARRGRPPTVVASALSLPLAVVATFVLHEGRILVLHFLLGGSRLASLVREHPALRLTLLLIGLLVVAAPWPAGLVMRFLDRERTSRASMLAAEEATAAARRETEHAREIAQLRDEQTRLARDVHDVVGHSLAVILAQAESGQYLGDDVTLKKTLRTIATSARSSLQDVRQVLSSTQDTATDRFHALIRGVRSGGREIVVTEFGTPRQLPHETGAVAYRVFQEMLTNAIKHGRRDGPITAERRWTAEVLTGVTDALRIEVSNLTADTDHDGAGRGLDGMRCRLEAIGGHLDVRRGGQPAGSSFTVTAFVPVRGGA